MRTLFAELASDDIIDIARSWMLDRGLCEVGEFFDTLFECFHRFELSMNQENLFWSTTIPCIFEESMTISMS